MQQITKGVYPVMLTPFLENGKIDWDAVDQIVEYYAQNGCQGIFAVCQSSEMFCLDEDERVALARRVVQAARKRMCVVASGHTADKLEDQIRELSRIHATGADAVVMVSNRLAARDEDDDVLIANIRVIMNAIPDAVFGMYECPYPYKRLLSEKVLGFMAACGRFSFIKDTCCDAALIARRIGLLQGRVQLFNANSATLLDSLRAGADGFSGIMANLHPDLYVWLTNNWEKAPEKADLLSAFLTLASGIERGWYPTTGKYHMQRMGLSLQRYCRAQDAEKMTALNRREIDALIPLEAFVRKLLA